MGGSQTKESGPTAKAPSKQELADEKQIAIALKFLQNPEVASISIETKTAFLKNNGLTVDQITKAYTRYEELKNNQERGTTTPSDSSSSRTARTSDKPFDKK